MYSNCARNVSKLRPKCIQFAPKMYPNSLKMYLNCTRNIFKLHPKCILTVLKMYPNSFKLYQNSLKMYPNSLNVSKFTQNASIFSYFFPFKLSLGKSLIKLKGFESFQDKLPRFDCLDGLLWITVMFSFHGSIHIGQLDLTAKIHVNR